MPNISTVSDKYEEQMEIIRGMNKFQIRVQFKLYFEWNK